MRHKVHNYTNEIELKSMLIRIKNHKNHYGTFKYATRINKYITWYKHIDDKAYDSDQLKVKKRKVLSDLKAEIIKLSEVTQIDAKSYENFGKIVNLIINRILTKPQFSKYTYTDDFYSDSIFKILKYINNFDHKKISRVSGTYVNAFAYISQIIHNAIIFIISKNKRYHKFLESEAKKQLVVQNISKGINLINESFKEVNYELPVKYFYLKSSNIIPEITEICKNTYFEKFSRVFFVYADSYNVNSNEIQEFNILKCTYSNIGLINSRSL